jgi:hypothetical protein
MSLDTILKNGKLRGAVRFFWLPLHFHTIRTQAHTLHMDQIFFQETKTGSKYFRPICESAGIFQIFPKFRHNFQNFI